MFLGQYEHIIDEKGRMTIPARYRELLADGAYITQGFDQNLIVLTTASFTTIYERVNEMSVTDPNARQLRRLMFSRVTVLDFDKAGRILIPQFLRQSNCLESSAMVVGVGNYFEIWSPELWKRQNDLLQDAEANNQHFATLNLPL